MARFQRLDGKDVFFLTGTDEHGIKMPQTARKRGITARELADSNGAEFLRMTVALNASNDDFVRTNRAHSAEPRPNPFYWPPFIAAGRSRIESA